jgi:hypothetical protein
MGINLRFLPPIPDGMCIIESDLEVAGVNHRIENAVAFAQQQDHTLELERELHNPEDPNAIKVFGISTTPAPTVSWLKSIVAKVTGGPPEPEPATTLVRHFVGYLPRNTAKRIAERGLWGSVLPRLKNIWVGGYQEAVVYIRLDILAPKPPKPEKAKKTRKTKT